MPFPVILLIIAGLLVWASRTAAANQRKRDEARKSEEASRREKQAAQRREASARLLTRKDRIEFAVSEFEEMVSGQRYARHRHLLRWRERHQEFIRGLDVDYDPDAVDALTVGHINALARYADKAEELVAVANQTFVSGALERHRGLFDTIESFPLNGDQRESIVHDEDANLVIAGAGTGKTSSIVGKVAYLLRSGACKPEEILLLAFTRKAAEEMRTRIGVRIGVDAEGVAIRTFHSFGLEVLAQARGAKPSLATGENSGVPNKTLADIFDALCQDDAYARRAVRYFAYLLQPAFTAKSFDTPGDYYRYLKSQKPLHLKGDRLAMKGDDLRSFEEVDIANFLFTNGVDYQYEADYQVRTADVAHRQYTPDFHLPAYDIYIEHFGVDRNGQVPDWFGPRNGKSASQAYADDMAWKRQLHRDNKTTLIETFSYEKREGVLLDNLRLKLDKHGVVLRELSGTELIQKLREHADKPIPLLMKFIGTFLELTKSNGYGMAELRNNVGRVEDRERALAFLDLFEPLYAKYAETLRAKGEIDFSDMISQATQHIVNRDYVSPFKHVLVDEFQDISVGRYRMLRALLGQNEEQALYCVGDDWQSIYRFTGSDISVMAKFEEHFGYAKKTALATTYRFAQPIADLSSKFVMRNPNQIPKVITAYRQGEETAVPCEVRHATDMAQEVAAVLSTLAGAGDGVSVGVLGRYHHDAPPGLDSIAARVNKLQVTFSTVHAAKGLEWDYVIICNVSAGRYGFPTEICDDPLLALVLSGDEGARNPEERRLFYVALTRARRKVFILTDPARPSVFAKELDAESGKVALCPTCKTGFLVQRSGGTFMGCDNYPYCTYTVVPGGKLCPKCEAGSLVHRYGPWSRFLGCTNRGCDYKQKDPEPCPNSGCTGQLVRREGPHGPFLGCSNYRRTECGYKRDL